MIKRAILVGAGLGLTSLVLFGRDAASYVKTSYHRVTSTVQDQVPIDFQIDRARQMVKDLDPEIRNSMHVIAKEEVALDQLNQQLATNQDKADKEKKDILHLQADLGEKKSVYQYASHTYSCDEVKQDLARRFSRFKVADDTLGSMKQMRDARQKNLDAAQQKLGAMISARRKLEVDVQNLEAKRKLVEVAQASSDYVFDDSQLARAKDLINDIRTRLDVAAKLANADVNVQAEIPLDDAAPADITDQVTQYFKLAPKQGLMEEAVVKVDPAKGTEASPVSLAHE
jgi:chromosome segregation ATPase